MKKGTVTIEIEEYFELNSLRESDKLKNQGGHVSFEQAKIQQKKLYAVLENRTQEITSLKEEVGRLENWIALSALIIFFLVIFIFAILS